jgi:hypothetical protein
MTTFFHVELYTSNTYLLTNQIIHNLLSITKIIYVNKDKYSFFSIIQVNGMLRATPAHSVAF